MGAMISEIYGACRDAGASEEKARKAAEVVAGVDERHQEIRREFAEEKHEFGVPRGEFNVVKWTLATNLTLSLLVLGKLFLR
jgi:hypothetical protein